MPAVGQETSVLALPTGALASGIPCGLAPQRHCRGRDACCLRDPGFPCLCGTRRPAAASRCLRLPAGRAGLRAARVVTATGDRADVRDLADDRRCRGRNGGRGRPALCADCEPRRVSGCRALLDGLDPAAERARQVDQRQYSGGFQGRGRVDHRDDPAPEPVRCCQAAGTISSNGSALCRANRPNPLPRAGSEHCCDRAPCVWRAVVSGKADRSRRCRSVDHRGIRVRASRPWRAGDGRDPGRPADPCGPSGAVARH